MSDSTADDLDGLDFPSYDYTEWTREAVEERYWEWLPFFDELCRRLDSPNKFTLRMALFMRAFGHISWELRRREVEEQYQQLELPFDPPLPS